MIFSSDNSVKSIFDSANAVEPIFSTGGDSSVYSYAFSGSEVSRALNGISRRTIALLLHEQDNSANPTYSYEGFFYRNANPLRGVIGWGGHAFTDSSVTTADPIISQEIDLTNISIAPPQLPFDRGKAGKAWDSDDGMGAGSGLLGRAFDVSANAFTDPALVVETDFIFGYCREFGLSSTVSVSDGQGILQFQVQARDAGNSWMESALTGTFLTALPAVNATGAKPITGATKLKLGVARDFDAPVLSGGTINTSTSNTLLYANATIPSGAADTLPVLTVHSLIGSSLANRGTRFLAAGAFFISNTATEGFAAHCMANPYTNSYDFGTGADFKIMNEQVFSQLYAAIGFNCLIIRTGGWHGNGFLSSNNQPDMVAALRNNVDPKTGSISGLPYNTAPYGDYKGDYVESEDDRQRNIHTDIGIDVNVTKAFPTVFLLSNWMGAGTTLAEAALIRATTRKAIEWGITHPTDTPNHASPPQEWLYNAALIDPWYSVSITTMLTGGTTGYVRATGTRIHPSGETWVSGRSFLAGDVTNDVNAADYLIGNEGWYYCNAPHTSAASGVNGPPSDPLQTRWTKCDLRLSDVGKEYETQKFWQLVRASVS